MSEQKTVWKAEVTDTWTLMKAIIDGKSPFGCFRANQYGLDKIADIYRDTQKFPGLRIYSETVPIESEEPRYELELTREELKQLWFAFIEGYREHTAKVGHTEHVTIDIVWNKLNKLLRTRPEEHTKEKA